MGIPDKLKKLFPTADESREETERKVVEYLRANPLVTRKHILAKFKIKPWVSRAICKKYGIKFNGARSLPSVREERLDMYYQGWCLHRIARHLQLCPKGISKWFRKALGDDFRLKPQDRLPRGDMDDSANQ